MWFLMEKTANDTLLLTGHMNLWDTHYLIGNTVTLKSWNTKEEGSKRKLKMLLITHCTCVVYLDAEDNRPVSRCQNTTIYIYFSLELRSWHDSSDNWSGSHFWWIKWWVNVYQVRTLLPSEVVINKNVTLTCRVYYAFCNNSIYL